MSMASTVTVLKISGGVHINKNVYKCAFVGSRFYGVNINYMCVLAAGKV